MELPELTPERAALAKSLAAQLGVVAVAAMACTEFLPLIPKSWVAPPYRKRIIALLYALPLSLAAVLLGFVELPRLHHINNLPVPAYVLRWAMVPVLAVLSVVFAHVYHGGWGIVKRAVARDYDNRGGPKQPK